MSVTASLLYGKLPCKVEEQQETRQQVLEKFINSALSQKRSPSEIDHLKIRLKEKALILDKAYKGGSLKKNKHVPQKYIKQLRFYSLPKNAKYIDFLPLHELWQHHIESVLGSRLQAEKILKMEYHGAMFLVQNAKCKYFIGLKGIVVKETKNMIFLITSQDEFKRIPKKNSVFQMEFHDKLIKISGNAIRYTPDIRSSKKIKNNRPDFLLLS